MPNLSSFVPSRSRFASLRRIGVFVTWLALLAAPLARAADVPREVPLWEMGGPDWPHRLPESAEDKRETGRLDRWVGYVSKPTLTVYPAEGPNPSDAAVLVIPGGGFRYVCIDKEGIEAARWLNKIGVTAVVLKYRTLDPEVERSGKTIEPLFVDSERAMRVMRHHSAEWKIHPDKISVLGFSAGAVMAIRLAVDADAGDSTARDPVEKLSSRPNALALIYGGIPPKVPKTLPQMPPVFLVHAVDDPKANISVAQTIMKFVLDSDGSIEFHAFHRGDHGFGMEPKSGTVRAWPSLYGAWLQDRGLARP